MTDTVFLLGDPLLREMDCTRATTERARTIVWASDLRECDGRRAATTAFKDAAHAALDACRRRPGIRHLLLAYRADPAVTSMLRRRASGLAVLLHAELEQRAGRDVDVIVLDVSEIDDQALLLKRLEDLSPKPAGLAGVALGWPDIRDQSIRRAASNEYI